MRWIGLRLVFCGGNTVVSHDLAIVVGRQDGKGARHQVLTASGIKFCRPVASSFASSVVFEVLFTFHEDEHCLPALFTGDNVETDLCLAMCLCWHWWQGSTASTSTVYGDFLSA